MACAMSFKFDGIFRVALGPKFPLGSFYRATFDIARKGVLLKRVLQNSYFALFAVERPILKKRKKNTVNAFLTCKQMASMR